jgi:hypothetical protein
MKQDQLIATVDRLEGEMRQTFLRDGSIMTIGTVVDAGGVVDVVPDLGGDFAGALRASCGRYRAAAVWIAAEAWSAFERLPSAGSVNPEEWRGPSPSGRPDRCEVLLSQVEAAGFARTRLWPIVRDGESVRLGEMEEFRPSGGRLSGVLRRASSPIWAPPGMTGGGK